MLTDETRLRILCELENGPGLSQRGLAKLVGLTLGRSDNCLSALVEQGLVKDDIFRQCGNKLAYACQTTPRGISDKAQMIRKFLSVKIREHGAHRSEIEELKKK